MSSSGARVRVRGLSVSQKPWYDPMLAVPQPLITGLALPQPRDSHAQGRGSLPSHWGDPRRCQTL